MVKSYPRIYVTGAGGFLGQAVCKMMAYSDLEVVRNQYDLTNFVYGEELPEADMILHLAADVKGLAPNRAEPYRFMRRNTLMALNVIEMSRQMGGVPIVAAGSVCAYFSKSPLPFNETDFWMGKPDKSNYGYGLAKRFMAGALECAAMEYGLRYAHIISANLYGPHDSGFWDEGGHVIPSLIRRIHEAKINNDPQVVVWGSGMASRDMLYVEDAARAFVSASDYLLNGGCTLECNIGSGQERTIRSIAEIIAGLLEYRGELVFDTNRPDGQMRRCVDARQARKLLDWEPMVGFQAGLASTIRWYKDQLRNEVRV